MRNRRVGVWTIDERAFELRRPGASRKVSPKVMAVLLCLVDRPGEVVTKAELMELAWPGLVVSDGTIRRSISELRAVLDADPSHSPYIETIPKGGYRLLVRIEEGSPIHSGVPTRSGATWRWLAIGLLLVAAPVLFMTLYDAKNAGQAMVRLTALEGWEVAPSVSPDGKRLAFLHTLDGSRFTLSVSDMVGGPSRVLVPGADTRSIDWHDNERIIAVLENDEGCNIASVSLSGGVNRLLACDDAQETTVDTDVASGTILTIRRDGHVELYHDGASRVMRVPDSLITLQGALSPGAGRFVLASQYTQNGTIRLRLFDTSDGKFRASISTDVTSLRRLDWLNEQEILVVGSGVSPRSPTSIWNTQSLDLERIDLDGPWATSFDVLPTDRGVVTGRSVRTTRIWLDSTNVVLPAGSGFIFPSVSPTGDQLAVFDSSPNGGTLWIRTLDGRHARRLARLDGLMNSPVSWVTDNRVAYSHDGSVRMVSLHDMRTSSLGTPDAFHARTWAVPGDSNAVLTTRVEQHRMSIWRLSMSRPAVQLTQQGSSEALVGMLDSGYVFVHPDKPNVLWTRNFAGGPVRHWMDLSLHVPIRPADWIISDDGVTGITLQDDRTLAHLQPGHPKEARFTTLPVAARMITGNSPLVFVEELQRGSDLYLLDKPNEFRTP